MRNRNIDLEFGSEILGESLADEHLVTDDEPTNDTFDKVFQDTQFSINRAALTAETQEFHKRLSDHYKKLAQDAEAATPKVTDDSTLLRKRWSVDERAGYRQFFKDGIAKGKSAQTILDGWLEEFPTANPDCIKLMQAVCAEFA